MRIRAYLVVYRALNKCCINNKKMLHNFLYQCLKSSDISLALQDGK